MPKPSDYIKKGWCQGTNAKDSLGWFCVPSDPDAIGWCLSGAILAAYPNDPVKREKVCNQLPIVALVTWNDEPGRLQAEVVELLLSIGE